jgi:hypothetical protein
MSKLALWPPAAEMNVLVERAEQFVRAAKAPATLGPTAPTGRTSWCQRHQFTALPAEPTTLALYISDLASCRAVGTITPRLTRSPSRVRLPTSTHQPRPATWPSARPQGNPADHRDCPEVQDPASDQRSQEDHRTSPLRPNRSTGSSSALGRLPSIGTD